MYLFGVEAGHRDPKTVKNWASHWALDSAE